MVAEELTITGFAHRDHNLAGFDKAYALLTSGKMEEAAKLTALIALQYDPTQKDFAPTRNERLLAGSRLMSTSEGGEDAFTKAVRYQFVKARTAIDEGVLFVQNPSITIEKGHAIIDPKSVEVHLTPYTKERAQEWNDLAVQLLDDGGVEVLANHPAVMVVALGLAQWLDVGNLMLEPGYVGERLVYPGAPEMNLYQHFGVKPDTFVFFTHIKHKPGLYEHGKVDGPHLDRNTYLTSYRRIAELMRANQIPPDEDMDVKLDTIISPGSWFYDPQLATIDPDRLGYVQEIAGNIVVIGPAENLRPKQLEFALSSSEKRRQLHKEGIYHPQLVARKITLPQIEKLLISS